MTIDDRRTGVAWTLITIFRAAFDGLLAGEDPEQLAARLRPQAARAYDQLAAGLGDYGTGAIPTCRSVTPLAGRWRRLS